MERRWHYVYYSYEEWGRGYIGKRSSKVPPSQDSYMGSFKDKTFRPVHKIILAVFETSKQALEAEIALHSFYKVDENPHFANQARQTSSGFCWHGKLTEVLSPQQQVAWRRKISDKINSGSRGFFYKLTAPGGAIHVTINLNEFCKDHGLNRSNIEQVAKGNRKHHKGWQAERMEMKR